MNTKLYRLKSGKYYDAQGNRYLPGDVVSLNEDQYAAFRTTFEPLPESEQDTPEVRQDVVADPPPPQPAPEQTVEVPVDTSDPVPAPLPEADPVEERVSEPVAPKPVPVPQPKRSHKRKR